MVDIRIFNDIHLEFYGGGEAGGIALANGLSRRGWKVDYVADSLSTFPSRISTEQLGTLIESFTYRRIPFCDYTTRWTRGVFHRLPCLGDLTRSGMNLIIVHRPPPIRFVREIAREKVRVTLLLQGLSIENLSQSSVALFGYQVFLRTYFRLLSDQLTTDWIHFQVLSRRMGDFLLRCGIKRQNISVIPMGVAFNRFSVGSMTRFNVLFMARIDRLTKGIDLLVRVLDRLESQLPQDMTVTILGTGPDDAYLRRKIEPHRESGRVEFRGFVPESEKRRLLATAGLMLVTSRVEPFSMTTVEALASGVPILSTPVSGPTEIIASDPAFGVLSRPNPGAFVERILEYYHRWQSDPIGYDIAREKRQKAASALFGEEAMVEAYANMISQNLDNGGGRHCTT